MKAILFKGGKAEWADVPRPVAGAGEALVRVRMVGICNTDLELLDGYYGFEGIPGHEFVGVVEDAPPETELSGKRVVVSINIGCGHCHWCLNRDPRMCGDRKAIGIKGWDGAFTEYVLAPLENIHLVPDSLSDEEAVFVEPLAAALAVGESVHLKPQTRLAVIGDGKLGLLIALGLRAFCPDITLIGKHDSRLSLAGRQGVKVVKVTPDGDSPRDIEAFDVVVEATGNPMGLNRALDMVRPRGVIVAKTTSRDPSRVDLARIVVDEISVIGSRCGDFPLALRHLTAGCLDVQPLIDEVYPFSDFPKALDHARRHGSGKILIKM